MEKKFCSSKQYVNISCKRISNFYSILMEVFFLYFFFYLARSLKFIYFFLFLSVLKYFLNADESPRVLFIMFAIDSTGLEFYFAKISANIVSKILSIDVSFFFFFSLFLNIRPMFQ